MIGTTISHYTVLEELGRGGMGVVYKARDTRLDRVVALKFLPDQSGTSATDRERFFREARAAAVLNHPNIATVYEIDAEEPAGGQKAPIFIAMEYVEGRSLRDIIDAGPLKIDEALRIAAQIAEGLHAAHEKGVVHRDVKSANIMVSDKGKVKIMDFGLAKVGQGRTMITAAGSTLGTAAYMSPEQARGEPVDHRTDIWGLGVILYEMITGRLPFRGDYANALVYAILNEPPEPLTALRTGVPVALDTIIAKMLAKDPGQRYQNIEEVPVDLRAIYAQRESSSVVHPQRPPVQQPPRRSWVWAVTGFALGCVVMGLVFRLLSPSERGAGERAPASAFSIVLPDSVMLAPVGSAPLSIGQPVLSISPDGSRIAYVGRTVAGVRLYVRSLNGFESRALPGTENAYFPFFSPDGRWIGFFAGNQLKKISVDGTSVVTLCEAANPRGAAWARDDRIFFCEKEGARVRWIHAGGGTVHALSLTRPAASGYTEYPHVLPGGKSLVSGGIAGLKVLSLDDAIEKPLGVQGSSPKYIATGHLVYYADGSLMAVPFDVARGEITGDPVPILDRVLAEAPHLAAHFAVSDDGTLVYVDGSIDPNTHLVLVDRHGAREQLPFSATRFGTFQLSPNGRLLVVEARILGPDIWIYDLVKKSRTRITTDGNSRYPIWTPDGKSIVYASGVGSDRRIIRAGAGGSGTREVLEKTEGGVPYAFSPDGRYLCFTHADSVTSNDILIVDCLNGGEVIRFAATVATEWGPSVSADGKYIAYVSDESGQYEVYVQPFPPDGRRWQVSTEGGEEPIWSRTGGELFYRRGQEWPAIEVRTEREFSIGKSTVALRGAYVNVSGRSYDVTRDGQKFLVLQRSDAGERLGEIRLVTHWFTEIDVKLRGEAGTDFNRSAR